MRGFTTKLNAFAVTFHHFRFQFSSTLSIFNLLDRSPIKFRCGNPSGRGVLKPTPMTLQRVLENKIVQPKKQAHQIIHNECEFSDDEG